MAGRLTYRPEEVYCALCAVRRASTLSVLPKRGITPVCDDCWHDCESADATLTSFSEWRQLYNRLKQPSV